jgi:phosphoglycerol transferase
MGTKRVWLETAVTALLSLAIALLVFGPLAGDLNDALAEGDMLSTYVNIDTWRGFAFASSTHYGYPFGMDLNLFPTIDITQNTFASAVLLLSGSPFLGMNLLLVLSFPIVAVLAYFTIQLVGLRGPLAIALAISFTMIPYHFGRGLGHVYLATLYAAVTGVALALMIGNGQLTRWLQGPRKVPVIVMLAVLVVVTAWSGVYYAAFALILGAAALLWRLIQRDNVKTLVVLAIPVAAIGILAVIGFLPSLLALNANPPFGSLGQRMPYESVILAGVLAMALFPAPTSTLGLLQPYNNALLKAVGAAPALENTTLPNFGTIVTSGALVVFLVGWAIAKRSDPRRPLYAYLAYLIVVVVLFFIPWGLNYFVAGIITPQIRAWNRLLPILLLLFILGGAAVLARTKFSRPSAVTIVASVAIIAVTITQGVLPFRTTYASSVQETQKTTTAARSYAAAINDAVPQDCAVLQLPYVGFPEQGPLPPELNDYEHFWQPLTNPAKSWSYGVARNTAGSVWASQLPQVPTEVQIAVLADAGFCGIHLDRRGFARNNWNDVTGYLTTRLGRPAAVDLDGDWVFYALEDFTLPTPPDTWNEALIRFFAPPRIEPDPGTTTPRNSRLTDYWWWMTSAKTAFEITGIDARVPISSVRGEIRGPDCSNGSVVLTLDTPGEQRQVELTPNARSNTPFTFTLPTPVNAATLTVRTAATGCPVPRTTDRVFGQLLNVRAN